MPIAAPSHTTVPVPALSVVIASVNGWETLGPTLDALDAQPERSRMEVVVVDVVGGETRERLRSRTPKVELIEVKASDRSGISELRFLGVERSLGELIAILEDHGVVGPDWAATLISAHGDASPDAVGGFIETGRERPVDWAAFFAEYTRDMSPVIAGEHSNPAGNNIAYKRPHLLRRVSEHRLREGRWETWINDKLRGDGVEIAPTNAVSGHEVKRLRLDQYLIRRFHFARSYAGMRRLDQTFASRLIHGFGSLALPGLLMFRVTRTALANGRRLTEFVAAAPLIALFLTVGAYGEMLGYLFGPGSSLDRVAPR